MYLGQLGFHILSTPTPPEEGWGRQNVDTVVAKLWTGIACDATRIGHSRCILTNLTSIPTPSEEGWARQNVDAIILLCLRCYARCARHDVLDDIASLARAALPPQPILLRTRHLLSYYAGAGTHFTHLAEEGVPCLCREEVPRYVSEQDRG